MGSAGKDVEIVNVAIVSADHERYYIYWLGPWGVGRNFCRIVKSTRTADQSDQFWCAFSFCLFSQLERGARHRRQETGKERMTGVGRQWSTPPGQTLAESKGRLGTAHLLAFSFFSTGLTLSSLVMQSTLMPKASFLCCQTLMPSRSPF